MKNNGIELIVLIWVIINFLAYVIFGTFGALITSYTCMAILVIGRNKLIKIFKL